MAQLTGSATIKDIIASLQSLEGLNSKADLAALLTSWGCTLTGSENMADLINILNGHIPNLIADNVKKDVTIAGVTGSKLQYGSGDNVNPNNMKISATLLASILTPLPYPNMYLVGSFGQLGHLFMSNGKLILYDNNLNVKWEHDFGGSSYGLLNSRGITLGDDGYLYALKKYTSTNTQLYLVKLSPADGSEVASTLIDTYSNTTTIYIKNLCFYNNHIYTVKVTNQATIYEYDLSLTATGKSFVSPNTLYYITADNGLLYGATSPSAGAVVVINIGTGTAVSTNISTYFTMAKMVIDKVTHYLYLVYSYTGNEYGYYVYYWNGSSLVQIGMPVKISTIYGQNLEMLDNQLYVYTTFGASYLPYAMIHKMADNYAAISYSPIGHYSADFSKIITFGSETSSDQISYMSLGLSDKLTAIAWAANYIKIFEIDQSIS